MGKERVFFGGVPTEPDVKKLMDAIDVKALPKGSSIEYETVSEIIGIQYKAPRWRSVTLSWRKKLEKDFGIIIDCSQTESAFIVLTEGGKVGLSGRKLRSAVSSARRAYIVSGQVDVKQLSEDEKAKHDFFSARAGNILVSAQLRSGNKNLPELTSR